MADEPDKQDGGDVGGGTTSEAGGQGTSQSGPAPKSKAQTQDTTDLNAVREEAAKQAREEAAKQFRELFGVEKDEDLQALAKQRKEQQDAEKTAQERLKEEQAKRAELEQGIAFRDRRDSFRAACAKLNIPAERIEDSYVPAPDGDKQIDFEAAAKQLAEAKPYLVARPKEADTNGAGGRGGNGGGNSQEALKAAQEAAERVTGTGRFA